MPAVPFYTGGAKLLEIAPPGTLDPILSLYNSTMYLMAFLLFLALLSNALMKPVHRATACPRLTVRDIGSRSKERRSSCRRALQSLLVGSMLFV